METMFAVVTFPLVTGFVLFFLNTILAIISKKETGKAFKNKLSNILFVIESILVLTIVFGANLLGKFSFLVSIALFIMGLLLTIIQLNYLRAKEVLEKSQKNLLLIGIILNMVTITKVVLFGSKVLPILLLLYLMCLSVIFVRKHSVVDFNIYYWIGILIISVMNGIGNSLGASIETTNSIVKPYMEFQKILNIGSVSPQIISIIIAVAMIIFNFIIKTIGKRKVR